jgi:hypothetical protein
MGEYAIRKSDGEEIKIGTLEEMYYIRYEDQSKVTLKPNNRFGYRWRLPFPDEDNLQPGDYKQHNRRCRLYKARDDKKGYDDFTDESKVSENGLVQLTHECGLLINVPCFHGIKLPEVTDPMSIFWNSKSWFFELRFIRSTEEGLFPVVGCRFCQQQWRYSWDQILPYVQDKELKKRLELYAIRNHK